MDVITSNKCFLSYDLSILFIVQCSTVYIVDSQLAGFLRIYFKRGSTFDNYSASNRFFHRENEISN